MITDDCLSRGLYKVHNGVTGVYRDLVTIFPITLYLTLVLIDFFIIIEGDLIR